MSTEAINRQRKDSAADKADRTERAMRAVKVFRAMQYGLTSYARAITGNPSVRVEIGTGAPHTDGTTIFYRPPIRLGDDLQHDRQQCDKRDEHGLLICEACAVREEVLVNVYHEIAHIAFDTFAQTTDEARRDAIQLAVDEWGSAYADRIKQAIESAPAALTSSYLGLAKLISPFLPHLLNCLEDARVDGSMFEARKGTKKMLTADTYSLLRDGIPQPDGSILTWLEADLNSQAGIACYLAGAGYVGWQEYLHPQVGRDFADATMEELIEELQRARTAADTYLLSFSFLARLRELGYFKMPDDPEEEDQQDDGTDEQPDVSDESDDEGGDPMPGGDSDGSPDEASEQGADESDDEAPGGDEPAGEGAPAEPSDDDDAGGSGEDHAPTGGGAGDAPGDPNDDGSGELEGPGESAPLDEGGADDGAAGGDDASEEAGDADPDAGAGGGSEGTEAGDGGSASGDQDADEEHDPAAPGAGGDQDGAEGVPLAGEAEPEAGPEDSGDAGAGDDDRDAPSGGAGDPEGTPEGDRGGLGDDADTDPVPPEADGGAGEPEGSPSGDDSESPAEPDVQPSEEGAGGGDAPVEGVPGDGGELDPGDDLGADETSGGMDGGGSGDVHGPELDDDLEGQLDAGGSGDDEVAGDAPEGTGGSGSLSGGIDYAAESDSDRDAAPEIQPDGEADGPDDGQPELGDRADDEGPAEAVDSGADQGLGGVKVIEADEPPKPEYGTPEQFESNVNVHERQGEVPDAVKESEADQAAVEVAVMQGLYFETPSANVGAVVEHRPTDEGVNCFNVHTELDERDRIQAGIQCDMDIPETILGPNLLALRRIFSDNKRSAMERNRKSGKVNARSLGRRAWHDDSRLFQKKRVAEKKDYAVLIGIDISSSTLGMNLALAKRAAMAQAELCHRLGIDFAVFAHCAGIGDNHGNGQREFVMDIYRIKDFGAAWNPTAVSALSNICGYGGNLDGHTMEFYRRELDKVQATDKVLLYYTDGKMPAANHDEELEVLQREIKTCRQRNYTLLGVGIRTDSPTRHGLDTVQVDDDDDLRSVVNHLGKRLARPGR